MDINFLNLAWKCLLVILILTPFGVLLRLFTSKQVLYRDIHWIKESKTILKEIRAVSPMLALIFAIEGVITNLALVLGIIFLVVGIFVN